MAVRSECLRICGSFRLHYSYRLTGTFLNEFLVYKYQQSLYHWERLEKVKKKFDILLFFRGKSSSLSLQYKRHKLIKSGWKEEHALNIFESRRNWDICILSLIQRPLLRCGLIPFIIKYSHLFAVPLAWEKTKQEACFGVHFSESCWVTKAILCNYLDKTLG